LIHLTQKKVTSLLFVADKVNIANDCLSRLRNEMARRLGLIKEGVYKFAWITDFPLFEWNEMKKRFERCTIRLQAHGRGYR